MKNTTWYFELAVIGLLTLVGFLFLALLIAINPVIHIGPLHADLNAWRVVICKAGDAICQGNPFGFPIPGGMP